MNSRLARMFLTHSYTLTVFVFGICCNIISRAMYVPVRPTPALCTKMNNSQTYESFWHTCSGSTEVGCTDFEHELAGLF